ERGLELALLGGGGRAGQALLSAAPRFLGLLDGDLLGVLGHVGQHGHALRQHLEEATAHEEHLLLAAVHLLDPQRTGLEDGHQRCVASEDAELALGAVGDHELDVALEEAALDADDPEGVLHRWSDLILSACSRASSMLPTMQKACSGRSSCLPSRISLNPRTVS